MFCLKGLVICHIVMFRLKFLEICKIVIFYPKLHVIYNVVTFYMNCVWLILTTFTLAFPDYITTTWSCRRVNFPGASAQVLHCCVCIIDCHVRIQAVTEACIIVTVFGNFEIRYFGNWVGGVQLETELLPSYLCTEWFLCDIMPRHQSKKLN